LLDNHHNQWHRADDLEKRIDEFAIRQRRRIASLLDQTPNYRQSHLRLFVTHQCDSDSIEPNWTLVVEGKLLVGHLDHQSAAKVEEAALRKARESGAVKAAIADPTLSLTPLARSTDRSQYRSVGEREEDPVEAIYFTHFFDYVKVDFQTVFQPPVVPAQSRSPPTMATPSKKPRNKRKQPSTDMDEARPNIDPSLLSLSPMTSVQWSKSLSQTEDSHAFFIRYKQPQAARSNVLHSVVATITLTPSFQDDRYMPSTALASAFFPKHLTTDNSPAGSGAKRRKGNDGGDATDNAATERAVPLVCRTIVPGTLSWNEIVATLSQYAVEKQLQDEADKSIIHNDALLQNLFSCERMSFSNLKELLLSRDLISVANLDPILITYIMREQTASTKQVLGSLQAEAQVVNTSAQMLSFDIDVHVPSFFPYRARELLRRVKKREFEYTSSRTKARYVLMGFNKNNEEVVKSKIEHAICGKGFSSEHTPVFQALAKSSPPVSEARAAAQIDAKLCVLSESGQERNKAALVAWDLFETCRGKKLT
jgi:hypothetical protein